jgi:uncharacterized protein YgiM (DUF1202 family)
MTLGIFWWTVRMSRRNPAVFALLILAGAILACSKASPEEIRHYTLTPSLTPTSTPSLTPSATLDPILSNTGILDTGTPTPTPARVIAIEALNVRKSPSEDSPTVGYYKNGDLVTLTGRCDSGWAEIRFVWDGGETAWVNADFISAKNCG